MNHYPSLLYMHGLLIVLVMHVCCGHSTNWAMSVLELKKQEKHTFSDVLIGTASLVMIVLLLVRKLSSHIALITDIAQFKAAVENHLSNHKI